MKMSGDFAVRLSSTHKYVQYSLTSHTSDIPLPIFIFSHKFTTFPNHPQNTFKIILHSQQNPLPLSRQIKNKKHQTLKNIEDRIINVEHKRRDIEHKSPNVEHKTLNVEHKIIAISKKVPTLSIKVPTSSIKDETSSMTSSTLNVRVRHFFA